MFSTFKNRLYLDYGICRKFDTQPNRGYFTTFGTIITRFRISVTHLHLSRDRELLIHLTNS